MTAQLVGRGDVQRLGLTSNVDITSMMTEAPAKATPPSAASAIVLFVASACVFAGAYCGFARAKWPFLLPPQIDIFGFIFDLFGERVGGYVGGGFLGALGLALVALGIYILAKRDA